MAFLHSMGVEQVRAVDLNEALAARKTREKLLVALEKASAKGLINYGTLTA